MFTRMTGWRPKPFRPVILGFCLTLLIAGGGSSALALWSQSGSMTMQVKAGTLPSPDLQCAKVPNEAAVLVSWIPQRAGVTGYDVTVTRNGQAIKTVSYSAAVTSEKITPSTLGVGDYAYAVTVTAKYGTWQAQPAAWSTIRASVPLVGLLATISCS
jgi:hypothetical protein